VERVVLNGEKLRHQQKYYPSLSYAGLSHRFRKQLEIFLARPMSYPSDIHEYVLVVDAVWYSFKGKRWTIYLLAVKPRSKDIVFLLDPIMLRDRESVTGWEQAIATIPDCIRKRIDGFVSDNLTGLSTVADRHGWIHQLCHFHLLKEVWRRLGRRRPDHTTHTDIRERVYACLRILLSAHDREAGRATHELASLARDSHCPAKLRMIIHTTLRQEHRYRAYRSHPYLTLPTTTGIMESLGAQVRKRTSKLNTPEAVERWAKAYVRMKKTMKCNGKIPPN
jgi:hypothetical protein